MKIPSAVSMLLAALGCGSDFGMIDPGTRGEGTEPSLARPGVTQTGRNR